MTRRLARATTLAVVLIMSQHGVASSPPPADAEPQLGAGIARPQDDPANLTIGAGGANDMTYHGGPVQRSQKVFTIFWNPGSPFPFGYQATINQFVQDLNGSSYYAIVSQYGDQTGPIGTTLTFGGTWLDTTNPFPQTALSSSDLLAEVNRAKAANGWTSDGNSYFQIYTPPGITSTFGGGFICAVHWFANPAIGQILFPSAGCLPGTPYPNDQFADTAINWSAHEIMETVTDPLGNAWFHQNSGGEIGDLCNFNFGQRGFDGGNVTLGGHRYLVQEEYSNAHSSCVLSLATPSVVTGAASAIGPSNATLNGTVDPHDANISAYFQYGLTTGYGTTTSPQTIAADSGVTAMDGGAVSGLACGSLYHFRAVAQNGSGAWFGSDSVFLTSACGETPSWAYQDVGAVGIAGGFSTSSNGQFNVTSAGSDIWGTSDSFGYVYQPFTGDGNVSAGVVNVQNTDPFAKGGVMLRATLDPSSAFVIVDIRPNGEIEFMVRPHDGEATTFIAGGSVSFSSSPRLLLNREDGVVTAYLGVGAGWQTIGSVADTMPRNILAGMAVTSHDTSALTEAIFAQVTATTASLPAPWGQQDIGAVTLAGNASVANGTFTVSGAGSDIWGTADAFHYVYQPLSTDGQIIARVTGEQNTNVFAKAGVMLRQNLTAGSDEVILDAKPDGSVEFMVRSAQDGSTTFIAGKSPPFSGWLKLVRTGGTASGFVSVDGNTWTMVGSTSISMTTSYVGLAVTSHDDSVLNSAMFDNVTVSAGGNCGLPAGWTAQDVGSVGLTGSTCYSSGVFTVTGAGSDIWGTEDSFQYAARPLGGDGQIVARVTDEGNTNAFAKAGVMLRQDRSAGSADVILDVKPDGGIEFMTRSSAGSSTIFVAGSSLSFPVWLKLVRTGATVTGSISPDGSAWTVVGQASVSMTDSTVVGLAVTSHDTSVLNKVMFDNVSQ